MQSEWNSFKNFASQFFLWITKVPNKEKICFNLGETSIHYTIRYWSIKREIDIHRTDENFPEGDPRRHETLCRISLFSIGRLLVSLKNIDLGFASVLIRNKISVGKLGRYDCFLYPLDNSDAAFNDFLVIKKKGKQYRINKDFDFTKFGEFLTPEAALNHSIKCFTVYRYKNGNLLMNGHAYRLSSNKFHGDRSFIYFSNKMRRQLMKNIAVRLFNVLLKINFQNKKVVLDFMRNKVLRPYLNNHPKYRINRKTKKAIQANIIS